VARHSLKTTLEEDLRDGSGATQGGNRAPNRKIRHGDFSEIALLLQGVGHVFGVVTSEINRIRDAFSSVEGMGDTV
jgi:hypothetical protein